MFDKTIMIVVAVTFVIAFFLGALIVGGDWARAVQESGCVLK